VFRGEHLPRSPHARLHLVDYEDHAVPRGQLAQSLQERLRRHDVPTLTLDRFDDDRADLIGRRQVHQNLVRDERQALRSAAIGAAVVAIGIRVRRVIDARHERSEAAALDRFAGGQRQRPERPPVKAADERDDALPLRVIPGELERRLGRFCPRVRKKRPDVPVDRHDARQLLGEPHLRLVVEVGPRHVDELPSLIDDRRDHLGVRHAGRIHRDAGRAVEKPVAVDVLHHGPFAAGDHERIVAGVRRRHELPIAVDDRLRLGARERRLYIWCVH
jgi:hypothetical protein